MGKCDDIYRASLSAAREEYLKAKASGVMHPVVLLCPMDVYRLLRPEGKDYRADLNEAMDDEVGAKGVNVVIEDHAHLYEGFLVRSPGAARELGATPDPARPFRIVVMTMEGTKVFTGPSPES